MHRPIMFLIVILMGLASTPTLAASPVIIAFMPNQAGGHILLQDTPCGPTDAEGRAEGLVTLSTDDGGRVGARGCWRLTNDEISVITWEDGSTTVVLDFLRWTFLEAPGRWARTLGRPLRPR